MKFDFYTTLLLLTFTILQVLMPVKNFIWYYFLPLWERFETTILRIKIRIKSNRIVLQKHF